MGVIPIIRCPRIRRASLRRWSQRLEGATGLRFCCNRPYSGTEVIEDSGPHHLETGEVILYTSADSVLQFAAHVDVLSEPELYEACEAARGVMTASTGSGA